MVYNLWNSAFVQKFDFFWFTKSYLLYALLFKIEEKHVEDLQGIKVSKNIVTLRSYPRHSIVFSHSLSAWISMIHWSSPTVELKLFLFLYFFKKPLEISTNTLHFEGKHRRLGSFSEWRQRPQRWGFPVWIHLDCRKCRISRVGHAALIFQTSCLLGIERAVD